MISIADQLKIQLLNVRCSGNELPMIFTDLVFSDMHGSLIR